MFNHAIAYVMSVLASEKREEKGATAVEYGLLVALIAGVIITAVALLGTKLDALFSGIAGKL
jgi:pilus assembly protein Flp/PilA